MIITLKELQLSKISKVLFTFLLVMTMTSIAHLSFSQVGYAVYDNGTLTFSSGTSKPSGAYSLNTGANKPDWLEYSSDIKKVVFDKSFASCYPTSCYWWFSGCNKLATIEGISNLHTNNVTDMTNMFKDCAHLNSLDLRGFNTTKVTTMVCLLYNCSSLTDVDFSGFNTSNVEDMRYMFEGCSGLINLDLSSFNTSKITSTLNMFKRCTKLKRLILSSFNTSLVTNMNEMFSSCNCLETIFVGNNWSTASVLSANYMFSGCENLVGGNGTVFDKSTIEYAKIDGGESNPGYLTSSQYPVELHLVFNNKSQALVANPPSKAFQYRLGTSGEYSSTIPTATNVGEYIVYYRLPSEGINETSIKSTITKAQNNYVIKPAAITKLKASGTALALITEGKSNFGKVVYSLDNKTFSNAIPTATTPGDYTVYYKVEDNDNYFGISTQSIAVTIYDELPKTPYVVCENGIATFYYDENEPQGALPIRTSSDDTKWTYEIRSSITKVVFDESFKGYKPDRTRVWFRDFGNLKQLSGMENINTENLEYMDEMFQFCGNLKWVDLSGFNTSKVTDMTRLFWGCYNLQYVIVSKDWSTASLTKSDGMFGDCEKLHGSKGTAYNAECIDVTYARIDGGVDAPGYFTGVGETPIKASEIYVSVKDGVAKFCHDDAYPDDFLPLRSGEDDANWTSDIIKSITKVIFDDSFRDVEPTRCDYWFCGFENLTEISGMKENLNTEHVLHMEYMFYGCSSLTSLDLSGLNTAEVINMEKMLAACSNLKYIYVDEDWDVSFVSNSSYMFSWDPNLYGGQGSSPNELEVYDVRYARIDGGTDAPGYFTKVGETPFTPVTSVLNVASAADIKVWSANHTIFIDNAPSDTEYTIIDLNGRVLTTSKTKSTREEICINKNGVVVVVISGKAFKVVN